jgi:hypothetical protein
MELSIHSIVTSGTIMQLLAGTNLMNVHLALMRTGRCSAVRKNVSVLLGLFNAFAIDTNIFV